MSITEYINNPELLNEESLPILRDLVEQYPFYQTARMLYVTNLFVTHHQEFSEELRKASVMLADRKPLFYLIEGANYEIPQSASHQSNIETETDVNRTMSIIQQFMSNNSSQPMPSISDVTTDYASFLMTMDDLPQNEESNEENAPKLKGEDLIDSFINNTKGHQRFEMGDLEEEYTSPQISFKEEEIYTENMVNIYIKQGRYEQALEILRKICLNNPKKNTNFASQMQLLEVIIGQKSLK